jgi:hypothetical protein
MPRIADPELEQLCRSEDCAWTERDQLLGRLIDTTARSDAAIAIKLRSALNHGRIFTDGESVEADAEIVLSAIPDAKRLASRLR